MSGVNLKDKDEALPSNPLHLGRPLAHRPRLIALRRLVSASRTVFGDRRRVDLAQLADQIVQRRFAESARFDRALALHHL
jgi:hypothetical protein